MTLELLETAKYDFVSDVALKSSRSPSSDGVGGSFTAYSTQPKGIRTDSNSFRQCLRRLSRSMKNMPFFPRKCHKIYPKWTQLHGFSVHSTPNLWKMSAYFQLWIELEQNDHPK